MQHRLDLSGDQLGGLMSRTTQCPSIIRWVLAAAAAMALAFATAGPASAWSVDHPKITNAGIDFGLNWDGFGAPLNGGSLVWNVAANGAVKPHLTGNLYLNNSSGVRARMRIDYYDAAHNLLTTKWGGIVSAPDNALHVYAVDLEPYAANNVYHVHVSTTTEGAPNVFGIVGTDVEDI
jgi:hypothetical protein